MKLLISALLLMSSTSFAVLKPNGTLISDQCGQQGPWAVCTAHRQGIKGELLTIRYGRQLPLPYQIIAKKPINAGINPNVGAILLTLVDQNGKVFEAIERFVGNKLVSIHGTLPDGETFSAANFVYRVQIESL